MEVHKCSKEKDIGIMQNDIQTLYRRVTDIETENRGMRELITSVAILAENTQGIKEDVAGVKDDVADVKKDVNELKEAPSHEAKEFKKTVRNVTVTFVITAILTYIVTGFGG